MQKIILQAVTALLLNTLSGATLAFLLGIPPIWGAILAIVGSVLLSIYLPASKYPILRAGVLREIWSGEMAKRLHRSEGATWLDGISDASSLAENDVIHLVDVGIDPDVLINNTSYPIEVQELKDGDIALKLDKFQTKPTPVTDDELYASSYDKMARVKESHAIAISNSKFVKAAHAFCAQKHTPQTPVLKTTGEKDPVTGRVKMVMADITNLKRALDKLSVPAAGRRLVLCSDHVNDLLETDQNFEKQYNIDRTDGRVGRLYGFDIYEFDFTPIYTTAGEKKSVGAKAETGEFQCSFAFLDQRVFKCTGSTKMYYSEAGTDPQHQRNLINFRHYFLAMPKKQDAGAVIMSAHKP